MARHEALPQWEAPLFFSYSWVIMMMEKLVEWTVLAGGTEVLRQNLPRRHFVHHKSHLPDLGANPGRRSGKPATNRFRYGAAHYRKWTRKWLWPNLIYCSCACVDGFGGNHNNELIRVSTLLAEIWTPDLPITKQDCKHFTVQSKGHEEECIRRLRNQNSSWIMDLNVQQFKIECPKAVDHF
jgi:hypothetical protein